MMYTSRYANPELKKGIYYVVGISLGRPKFKLGYDENATCIMFAPNRSMWGKSHEEFTALYREKLDNLDQARVRRVLNSITESAAGRDIVFCCYEDVRDASQFCHRTDFAEWLHNKLGYDIIELHDDSPIRYKKRVKAEASVSQISLF